MVLKTTAKKVTNRLKRVAARNGVVAEGIDLITTRDLVREARAVAAGAVAYRDAHRSDEASYAVLRRNTHRVEKGLIMKPRRPEFALEFIAETVDAYVRLRHHLDRQSAHNNELVWAHDVLSEYFSVVQSDAAVVTRAREQFERCGAVASLSEGRDRSTPFVRQLENPSGIEPRQFNALATYRRSVRWYQDRLVPRELIDEAMMAARQAPSACNRQSFQFRVFDDRDLVRKVIEIPLGTKGFGHNVPALAVIVGRLRAYPNPRDRHAIYVDGSLAAMSFVFALETMGLASCLINWGDEEPRETIMSQQLGLTPDERVIVVIAFGFPDAEARVPYSAKRELEQFRMYNYESGNT